MTEVDSFFHTFSHEYGCTWRLKLLCLSLRILAEGTVAKHLPVGTELRQICYKLVMCTENHAVTLTYEYFCTRNDTSQARTHIHMQNPKCITKPQNTQ